MPEWWDNTTTRYATIIAVGVVVLIATSLITRTLRKESPDNE